MRLLALFVINAWEVSDRIHHSTANLAKARDNIPAIRGIERECAMHENLRLFPLCKGYHLAPPKHSIDDNSIDHRTVKYNRY